MLFSTPKLCNTFLVQYSQELRVDELFVFNASSTSSFCLQKIIHLQRKDTPSVEKPCTITALSKAHPAVQGADPGQHHTATHSLPLAAGLEENQKSPSAKKLVGGDKDSLISKGKRKEKAKASDAVWENQKALILHKCCSAIVKTPVIINQFQSQIQDMQKTGTVKYYHSFTSFQDVTDGVWFNFI